MGEVARPWLLSTPDFRTPPSGPQNLPRKLAENAAWYQGLDVANGPVRMMNHRLLMNGLGGCAVQGSALEMPFADESFDHV